MYDKLQEQAKIEYKKQCIQKYNQCNKDIDEHAEKGVAEAMSKGYKQWNLFYEDNPSIDYNHLFTKVYMKPYDKPILNRLKEKFPPPHFKCIVEHVHYETHDFFNPSSPDVNYYVVKVKWDIQDDCRCILF
jgi:hypothetical protein